MIATANIFSTVYRFTALFTMAKEYNHRYLLVDSYDTSSDKFQPTHRRRYRGWLVEYRNILAVSILLFISLAINVFLFVKNINKPGLEESGRSLYSHLKFDTLIPYQSNTKYWNPQINQSVSDQAWDEINTNPVAVALSNDYVKEHGLTESTRFPWDTERSVYYVKGLHDLHCLKLLRRAIVANQRNQKQLISYDHLFHCLDGLRQDIMCVADDTPMPAAKTHHIGDGQIRLCRDWNKLLAWSIQPEQNACHKFDDYREATNTLELFAFCPPDSPYYPVMESYFQIHGHKDPYEQKDDDTPRVR